MCVEANATAEARQFRSLRLCMVRIRRCQEVAPLSWSFKIDSLDETAKVRHERSHTSPAEMSPALFSAARITSRLAGPPFLKHRNVRGRSLKRAEKFANSPNSTISCPHGTCYHLRGHMGNPYGDGDKMAHLIVQKQMCPSSGRQHSTGIRRSSCTADVAHTGPFLFATSRQAMLDSFPYLCSTDDTFTPSEIEDSRGSRSAVLRHFCTVRPPSTHLLATVLGVSIAALGT